MVAVSEQVRTYVHVLTKLRQGDDVTRRGTRLHYLKLSSKFIMKHDREGLG